MAVGMLSFAYSILLGGVLISSCSFIQKNENAEKKGEQSSQSISEREAIFRDGGFEVPKSTETILFKNFNILPANGPAFVGDVLVEGEKISQVGPDLEAKADKVVDGTGKFLTPGLIDTHSHMGVYPLPEANAHGDGNEATRPQTAAVWAEHSFWPQDPSLHRALAGGITTIQVLPGSANLFGGRSVTVRPVARTSVKEMKFPGAPQGLKMACGENPKRVYGEKGGPSTRMGNFAGYRDEFQKALEYQAKLKKYQTSLDKWSDKGAEPSDKPDEPSVAHDMDTLVKVLDGEILVHIHCYRADEMLAMIDLAKTYGFSIRSFHHSLEAYKIAPTLANEGISISTWADWWGFKMEAMDGVPYNLAIAYKEGVKGILHSDSPEDVRFLNVEAAKAKSAGKSLGIDIPDSEVIKWITLNAAWALGIDKAVGSIEVGKFADLVVWDGPPLSAYAKAQRVYIQGALQYDRKLKIFPESDFERGQYLSAEIKSPIQSDYGMPNLPGLRAMTRKIDFKPAGDQLVIKDARIFDSNGKETVVSIFVKDGLIVEVKPTEKQPIDMDTWNVIDADGSLVTPGLIDPQTLLGLVVIEMEPSGQDHRAKDLLNPGFEVIEAIDPTSLHVPISREHGVTTVIVKPTGGLLAGQGVAMDLSQSEKAVVRTQKYLFGQITAGQQGRGQFWLKLREAFEDTLAFQKQRGFSSSRPLATDLSLSAVHMEPLLNVLQGEVPLVLSMDRLSDINASIRFKREMAKNGHKIDLIISGARESWMAAELLAEEKVPVIISPTKQLPYSLDSYRVRDDLAKFLSDKGVKVLFSADDLNVRRLRQQAGRAVSYGMAYHKAIAAMTENVAEVFRLQDRGLIKQGLRADLVLWDGDPLDPSGKVSAMWIEGKRQDLGHRQLELAKYYLKRHQQPKL